MFSISAWLFQSETIGLLWLQLHIALDTSSVAIFHKALVGSFGALFLGAILSSSSALSLPSLFTEAEVNKFQLVSHSTF